MFVTNKEYLADWDNQIEIDENQIEMNDNQIEINNNQIEINEQSDKFFDAILERMELLEKRIRDIEVNQRIRR